MPLQQSLSKNLDPLRRRLYDYKINVSGVLTQVLRLKITTDKYEDEEIDLISDDIITVYIDLGGFGELPLIRYRNGLLDIAPTNEGIYMYNIIPFKGYAKFNDRVEKGDLIIRKFSTENSNEPALIILKVTELTGSFSSTGLVWKSFNCSPFNGPLESISTNIISVLTKYCNS